MKVELKTEYCGRDEYRVTVLVDGKREETLTAHTYNVAGVRNRACERWSQCADEVVADGIPGAWDMGEKK